MQGNTENNYPHNPMSSEPTNNNNGGTREPDPLQNVVGRASTGSILTMQTGLYNLGLNRALQSGTTEPRPEDIRSLEDHARAIARETYRDKYDPRQNAHDRMIESEYQKLKADREKAEDLVQHGAANLRDAELKLARTPKAGPKPDVHPLVRPSAVIVITVTVAATLHDLLFANLDDLLAWFLAFVCGAFIGGFITWSILDGQRTVWKWLGMTAGVAMGIGLGLLRLSGASEGSEVLLAVAFTVVEIAAVVILEWRAIGLRKSVDQWTELQLRENQATGERDATQVELSRRQARVKELNQAVSEKISYVEDRHHRSLNVTELEAVAVKAVLDGYNAGISENIGRVRGVPRRSQ